jgi:arabinogalactan oligomer/maltooligosaccharide transport system permease protein
MTAAATTAPPPANRRSLWVRTREARTAWIYLIPALLVMGLITFYPLGFQVWMSFTDFSLRNLRPGAPAPPFVGLDNYVQILQSQLAIPNFNFLRLILFNLFWAFSNVAIHVVIGVGVAVLLNYPGFRFRNVYRAVFILPVVIPPIIVATVWRNMFDQDHGAINMALQAIGTTLFRLPPDAFRIDWLRQVQDPIPFVPLPLAYFALLTANSWLGWPLNAVVATGALQSIPKELYEAASMDGANAWHRFRNVTIPYLRPAMLPYAIYGFVITFNLFHLSYFMTGGGPFGRTELLVTQAYRLVNEQRLYGAAAAFSVIMFFILLAITLVVNRAAKATATADL